MITTRNVTEVSLSLISMMQFKLINKTIFIVKPKCSTCLKSKNQLCVYQPIDHEANNASSNKKNTKFYHFEQKISELEKELENLRNNSNNSNNNTVHSSNCTNNDHSGIFENAENLNHNYNSDHFNNSNIGSYNNIDHSHCFTGYYESQKAINLLSTTTVPQNKFSDLQITHPGWPLDFPEPDLCYHLVNTFFKSPLSSLIHRKSFESRMFLPPFHPDFPPRTVWHSIFCVASRFSPRVE